MITLAVNANSPLVTTAGATDARLATAPNVGGYATAQLLLAGVSAQYSPEMQNICQYFGWETDDSDRQASAYIYGVVMRLARPNQRTAADIAAGWTQIEGGLTENTPKTKMPQAEGGQAASNHYFLMAETEISFLVTGIAGESSLVDANVPANFELRFHVFI